MLPASTLVGFFLISCVLIVFTLFFLFCFVCLLHISWFQISCQQPTAGDASGKTLTRNSSLNLNSCSSRCRANLRYKSSSSLRCFISNRTWVSLSWQKKMNRKSLTVLWWIFTVCIYRYTHTKSSHRIALHGRVKRILYGSLDTDQIVMTPNRRCEEKVQGNITGVI